MNRSICVCLEFLTEALREKIEKAAAAEGFTVCFAENEEDARAHLADCEILFAHSVPLVQAAPATLKWYCCAYAGVDPYCRNDGIFANPDCLLSNSSGAYGVTIAEHILMVALMLLRRMPEYQETVRRRGWENSLPIRSIRSSRITVLGAGNIGSTFASRARGFEPERITGVSRSGIAREAVYDEMLPFSRLDEVLPRTDILVMALPGTPETVGLLSRERLALLPAHAIVINVGRGTALDQDALMDALNHDRLGGAALDVMMPEPLPPDHPLWNTRHLIITPHIAGNMTLGYTCERAVEMFCEDLKNYAEGRPLLRLVDRSRGY